MRYITKALHTHLDLAIELTLIGITGIEDPLRDGVREAVADCKMAGIRVTMCTGDNVLTAQSITQQCSIYTTGGIIMDGPHFRTLSPDIMRNIVPRLRVLTQSSPKDQQLLVETLKASTTMMTLLASLGTVPTMGLLSRRLIWGSLWVPQGPRSPKRHLILS